MIRFLFALLFVTTNLHPSAPSAAAEVKAHHDRGLTNKTKTDRVIVPEEVVKALTFVSNDPNVRAAQIKTIATWIDQDPERNKDGAFKADYSPVYTSIINQIIVRAFNFSSLEENFTPANINNEFRTYLPRILALNPNVCFLPNTCDGKEYSTLLHVMMAAPNQLALAQSREPQIETAKQVIVLLRGQGAPDEKISAEIDKRIKLCQEKIALAPTDRPQYIALIQYFLDLALAAKEYLHNLQVGEKAAAKIAEEELRQHLPAELANIATEYIAPLRKKDATKATKPAAPKACKPDQQEPENAYSAKCTIQ
jgi:hypothetical protein